MEARMPQIPKLIAQAEEIGAIGARGKVPRSWPAVSFDHYSVGYLGVAHQADQVS